MREALRPSSNLASATIGTGSRERRLDHRQAPIEVLLSIVGAVGDAAEVILDGGFVHGEDVAKALALGARAVLIGKMQCWGLAAGGSAALARLLELMREERRGRSRSVGVAAATHLCPGHTTTTDWG